MKYLIRAKGVYGFEQETPGGRGLLLNGPVIESVLCPPFPREVSSIDVGPCNIVPQFTDYHLHFFRKNLAMSGHIENLFLRAGIGTVYEGGDRQLIGLEMKERLKGRVNVKCSGHAISCKGGYGANLGREVGSLDEAKEVIDGLVLKKVDFIKLINAGIYIPGTGAISPGGWDAGEIAEIVSYTGEKGLEVACHANGDRAIRDAVMAGVSMVIHGFLASPDTLSLLRDRNVALVPTIAALSRLDRTITDPRDQQRLEDMVSRHLEMVTTAFSMGVKVLPGSDSGASFLPHGETFLEELRILARAGISVSDIFESTGTTPIVPGMAADFLALDGLKVKKVFLKGICVFEEND